jgi:hypothetical protein
MKDRMKDRNFDGKYRSGDARRSNGLSEISRDVSATVAPQFADFRNETVTSHSKKIVAQIYRHGVRGSRFIK